MDAPWMNYMHISTFRGHMRTWRAFLVKILGKGFES
nr:MAG TPA: Telomerase reverse transcriptase, Telomerase-associated protein, telomere, REPLICATION [Caudoviricetes sp.]